ncbi:hypothetical protein CWE22_10855 [Pseudidiomarina aestuarii]|uniref:Uncharacterized protein n=1 Tax=Pseudidiomarina aestuarii TaxID=624146 RepID=A0A7Z6ZS45_9GAMM|nr:hypothetical protein [Pseudidiomarina aestuarii]RUO39242.1 hypothetical protein CWE22_10855 [Pseudidiomarina aestuarii]
MDDRFKELLETVASMYEMGQSLSDEFFHLIDTDPDGRQIILDQLTSWSHWYSLSSAEFTSIAAGILGMASLFADGDLKGDKIEASLRFAEKAADFEGSLEDASKHFGEEIAQKLVFQVVFANYYSQLAVARRNRSINFMLEQIREEVDDYVEIIFEAVSIDPSVVSNYEIAQFISKWTVERNKINLDKLAKAILGKYPRGKREPSVDQHRFMTTVLEEFLGSVKPETVDQMNQLLGLLQEGEDPVEAIKYHLRIRKRDTRRTKAH